MKELTLRKIAEACHGTVAPEAETVTVTGVQSDSRRVRPGDLFVAIKGEKADGHDFVAMAASLGAKAALVARPVEAPIPTILVADTIRAYGDLAAAYREHAGITVIGITGSYGKTSVKYYLNTLLQAQFNSLMTPESYNTPMGVVKTIRGQLKPYHEVFVCEMGAQNVGDIKELCGIAGPRHGIITALGQQHLESFKSQENIIKTKYELADALPEDGFLLLNGDNELIRTNLPRHRFMTYGLNDENDYRASDVKVSSRGTVFTLHTPDGQSCDFQTALLGEHNIVNLTGALAMCHLLGIPLTALKPRLLKITAVPHRLQLIDHGSFAVIDDGFNSNPNGTQAALRTLSLFDDYKIMITPGMVELGEAQETLNREFGQNAARVCDYVILVGEKQTRPIARGLADAGFPAEKLYIAESLKDGLEHAHALKTERKKIILLENDLPDNY